MTYTQGAADERTFISPGHLLHGPGELGEVDPCQVVEEVPANGGEVEVEPLLVDARTGRPLSELDVGLIAGPAASESFRARLADAAAVTPR